MIEFEKLVSKIQSICHCSRDEAWTGLNTAYLELDRSRSEAEQSAYLLNIGIYRISNNMVEIPMSIYSSQVAIEDDDDTNIYDKLFQAREDIQADNDYIIELVRGIPDEYKLALAVVVHHLLSSPCQKRKPLSLEMTRQYLKKHQMANASEMARQVYTYLTTFNK